MVDWSSSQVNLSPLFPWLGSPDMSWPRRLMKKLVAKWPTLNSQLDVIELEVEIVGGPYEFGELMTVRAVSKTDAS